MAGPIKLFGFTLRHNDTLDPIQTLNQTCYKLCTGQKKTSPFLVNGHLGSCNQVFVDGRGVVLSHPRNRGHTTPLCSNVHRFTICWAYCWQHQNQQTTKFCRQNTNQQQNVRLQPTRNHSPAFQVSKHNPPHHSEHAL